MRTKSILASCVLVGSSIAAISGVVGAGTATGVTPTTTSFTSWFASRCPVIWWAKARTSSSGRGPYG